tara:strand:- start:796 stop:1641 length:846 start_codon:yes stop_codon:yes gene_type:complete
MNIIGLGKAGCKVAELFKKYPQYTVFKFDSDAKYKRKKNCFYIPQQSSVELYDANPIDLKRLSTSLDEDEEVYFVCCGSGKVSGSALWILHAVRHLKINIIYIKPATETLDLKSRLRDRAHFNILQEYTRSAVFNKIYLFDNNSMSDIIGKTSILQHFPKINDFIVNSVHWINIYNNSEPVFDTYREELKTSRICALSIINLNEEEEADTFSLEKCNQIKYFYGVNRIMVEEDETLLDKISRITSKSTDESTSASYGIYPTDLEVGFSFAIKSSSNIQTKE